MLEPVTENIPHYIKYMLEAKKYFVKLPPEVWLLGLSNNWKPFEKEEFSKMKQEFIKK